MSVVQIWNDLRRSQDEEAVKFFRARTSRTFITIHNKLNEAAKKILKDILTSKCTSLSSDYEENYTGT